MMQSRPIVVGLGEILWDVFPDGAKFGGAPANFACTAAELAGDRADVYMVGAVGHDALGREAIGLLAGHGANTSCVSQVEHPTGQVNVTLDAAGKPTFEIAESTAWDNLPWSDDLEQLAARADAVCFGTLVRRSPVSRDAVRRFVRATRPDCLRILDINLRAPFWTEAVIRDSLELANVLKLNDAELPIIARMLRLSDGDDEVLRQLLKVYDLRLIALTCGADGATLMSSTGERSQQAVEPVTIVDTVGAGDAYTAALAMGLLRGDSLETINKSGNRVAAYVCTQAGGTPEFPEHLRLS